MKLIISFFTFLILFFVFPLPVKAIVILAPVVLIPIVKIVALIITAIATPVVGFSVWFMKLKKRSILFGIFIGVIILITLAMLIAFGIKIISPDRPLF